MYRLYNFCVPDVDLSHGDWSDNIMQSGLYSFVLVGSFNIHLKVFEQ
jgi:hypothetical protein